VVAGKPSPVPLLSPYLGANRGGSAIVHVSVRTSEESTLRSTETGVEKRCKTGLLMAVRDTMASALAEARVQLERSCKKPIFMGTTCTFRTMRISLSTLAKIF
jgi:hypothetical protein